MQLGLASMYSSLTRTFVHLHVVLVMGTFTLCYMISFNFFRNSLNTSICMHELNFKNLTVILVTEVLRRLSITTLLVGFCYVFQTYNIFWPQGALIQYE